MRVFIIEYLIIRFFVFDKKLELNKIITKVYQ